MLGDACQGQNTLAYFVGESLAERKGFIARKPVANVIKHFFCIICKIIGIALFKTIMKYAESGINYTEKSFMTFTYAPCY